MRSCKACGITVDQISAKCIHCGVEFTHRDCYPDQYQHPMCGHKVIVTIKGKRVAAGIIERIVSTRFGLLAHLDNSGTGAYALSDCKAADRIDEEGAAKKAAIRGDVKFTHND